MIKLVLLRHGESIWNKENRFTGWTDVDLSEKGTSEAKRAANLLIERRYTFDIAFTSVLKRAIRTLWILLDEMDLMWIPVHHSWRLNERHYGALQGLNKTEVASQVGEKQVFTWRRSYGIRPPGLNRTDPRYPRHDPRYENLPDENIPLTESLKNTVERVLPYWHEVIAPLVKSGNRTIISAHGNSLRALIKYLDDIGDEAIVNLNIPTGIPLVYELNVDLHPLKHYYLADEKEVERAIEVVSRQGVVS